MMNVEEKMFDDACSMVLSWIPWLRTDEFRMRWFVFPKSRGWI